MALNHTTSKKTEDGLQGKGIETWEAYFTRNIQSIFRRSEPKVSNEILTHIQTICAKLNIPYPSEEGSSSGAPSKSTLSAGERQFISSHTWFMLYVILKVDDETYRNYANDWSLACVNDFIKLRFSMKQWKKYETMEGYTAQSQRLDHFYAYLLNGVISLLQRTPNLLKETEQHEANYPFYRVDFPLALLMSEACRFQTKLNGQNPSELQIDLLALMPGAVIDKEFIITPEVYRFSLMRRLRAPGMDPAHDNPSLDYETHFWQTAFSSVPTSQLGMLSASMGLGTDPIVTMDKLHTAIRIDPDIANSRHNYKEPFSCFETNTLIDLYRMASCFTPEEFTERVELWLTTQKEAGIDIIAELFYRQKDSHSPIVQIINSHPAPEQLAPLSPYMGVLNSILANPKHLPAIVGSLNGFSQSHYSAVNGDLMDRLKRFSRNLLNRRVAHDLERVKTLLDKAAESATTAPPSYAATMAMPAPNKLLNEDGIELLPIAEPISPLPAPDPESTQPSTRELELEARVAELEALAAEQQETIRVLSAENGSLTEQVADLTRKNMVGSATLSQLRAKQTATTALTSSPAATFTPARASTSTASTATSTSPQKTPCPS